MADAEDLIYLSTLDGNASVNGVKVGETLTALAEWQRRAKASLMYS